ncbi:hypothetical protein PENSPDRAFT_546886, partial [Peniophora sp. CONT]
HMPRNRLSETVLKFVIWMLKELGVRDVPTYHAFRAAQRAMRADYGVPTHPFTSPFNNHFHQNDVAEIVAMDWSNPKTRELLEPYPVIQEGPISEWFHANKFLSVIDVDMLSPMYDAGERHYYVKELAL